MNSSPVERFARLLPAQRVEITKQFTNHECEDLMGNWSQFLARPNQLPPESDWEIWLILAGRGFGKTRAGAEWVKEQVEQGAKSIALIGETAHDVRKVMVEGESGILSVYSPGEQPKYESSKKQITWKNGAKAHLYNATEPNQLRGPQHEIAWCDELAKWRYARETWDQLQFGLRKGKNPKQLITTTPRPIEVLKDIVNGMEGKTEVTRGNTVENKSNLSKKFIKKIENRYKNSRLGRQELNGEILDDLPNALWTLATIDKSRIKQTPENIERILISIDPATTSGEQSNEHGIIVAGIKQGHVYILEDYSRRGSPMQWAKTAINLYKKYEADGIVIETNQGGEMVKQTLKSISNEANIIEVRASRGKHIRAEPVASYYEQGLIHHIGAFPELETQMTNITTKGYEGAGSPDRLDALVWAITALFPEINQPEPRKVPKRAIYNVA